MFNKVINNPALVQIKNALGQEADLHLVGGVVRDILSGKEFKDIDLSTKLLATEVELKLTKANIRVIPVGIRRGTVMAVIGDESIEITTFRDPTNESNPSFCVLKDLEARDFTINAIAFSLNSMELVDPFQGAQDLSNGILKTVRNPRERFIEDPHRILRMVRFGPGQNRIVDEEVIKAAKELSNNLTQVNAERLYPELVKILTTENVAESLELLLQIGAIDVLLPELSKCVGFQQNKYHKHDVFTHIVSVTQATPPSKVVRLAALFHDIGKPDSLTIDLEGNRKFLGHEDVSTELAEKILLRLKAPKEDIKAITTLVSLHMKDIRMNKPKIRKLKSELGDLFEDWIVLKRADLLGGGRNLDFQTLALEWDEFINKVINLRTESPVHNLAHLALDGNDILNLGVKPGPKVGEILKQLHELVMEEPKFNTKEKLLETALTLI